MMIAKLIPADGSRPISITRDVTIVGRKRGLCDIVLDHPSVSKLHCSIARTDGLLFVRDLGSTNGTKVNGQRITRGALLPGDELTFASVRFRVHLGPGEPEVGHDQRTEMLTAVRERPLLDEPELVAVESGAIESDSDVRLLSDSQFSAA